MQYYPGYSQKPAASKASYRTLFLLLGKLLLIIMITFLVMLINISKTSASNNTTISVPVNSINTELINTAE